MQIIGTAPALRRGSRAPARSWCGAGKLRAKKERMDRNLGLFSSAWLLPLRLPFTLAVMNCAVPGKSETENVYLRYTR